MQASSAEPKTESQASRPLASVSIGRTIALIAGVCLWMLAMYGVLKFAEFDSGMTHSICGPWGCGPRSEALIACHGFWLLLLAPPAAFAARLSATGTVRLVALTALTVGAAGALVIVGQQVFVIMTRADAGEPSYFAQRCFFVIATTIELPLVQLLLIGAAGLAYVGWRNRRFRAAQRVIASDSETGPGESNR